MVIKRLMCVAAAVVSACATLARADDLAIIRGRLVASILPGPGEESARLVRSGRELMGRMTPEHTWADIDFTDQERNNWRVRPQLDRALVMAKAVAVARRDGRPEPKLAAAAVAALDYWIAHDYRNPNWWWNEIGVPDLMGETVVLLGDDCPPATRDGAVAIMKRSVWTKWTGQNLVWGCENQIMRGLITNDAALVSAGFDRMYQEIVVTTKDGIQPDYSFHQHGDQFYSGGYGLDFAQDVGRYIALAWGTGCQPPAEKVDIYNHFILDGEAWMTWGGLFGYSALGREITRKGKAAVPHDWTGGPIVPIGRAYGLGQTVGLLADLPVPRREEYKEFFGRLVGDPAARPLVGHRHFWRSDYTSHRRAGYFFSIKMFSTRLFNTELVNGEGKKSHHIGDGNTFLYRTGEEYRDIFPVWDWNRMPGTTAEQATDLDKLLPGGNHARGKTAFAGGASDGAYGVTAMTLERGKLSARKSWFCFDDQIVCLGSGIRCDSDNPVVTSVNQCYLHGPVARDEHGSSWVQHDGVGYVFPERQDVQLSAGAQSGAWSDLGGGPTAKVTASVFNLAITHGTRPTDAGYVYVLLPGATAAQTAERARSLGLEVLARTGAVHAVRHASLGITAAVFFEAGTVADVTVDRPCIVMVRNGKLTVCDPAHKGGSVRVTVGGKACQIELPEGPMAGSSVTAEVR